MKKVLAKKFFDGDTLTVARKLIGKFLVRKWRGREIVALITEVEVYDGFKDKASHASRGKTARNAPMFGPAGKWYVYFTYGMHWMLNIVTREKGYPAAVLIRGVSVVPAKARIWIKNWIPAQGRNDRMGWNDNNDLIINGPARLTKFLHVDKRFNGTSANRRTGLWIEDRGVLIKPSKIKKSPRIGVDYAGPLWAGKRWRLWI